MQGPSTLVLPSQRQVLVATQSEHSSTPQNNAPPSVSSFSQLGSSVNMGFGTRQESLLESDFVLIFMETIVSVGLPSTPSNNAFGQPTNNSYSSQTSSIFGTNNLPSASAGPFGSQLSAQSVRSSFTSNMTGFGNSGAEQATVNIQLMKNLQSESVTGDSSVWLKEKWIPGEIPEEAPPDAFCME
ncbi:hypothetical protein Patl1_14871 [Pistacia atlantica]|uniref:Uncharacterized protein n=1 Tax=Pistacia atlantica TaxID=434234 RepID=A0ACC1AUH7_9ROSI|nr:hypothetical protein Patl1_14871 [Pistacia atlantica]